MTTVPVTLVILFAVAAVSNAKLWTDSRNNLVFQEDDLVEGTKDERGEPFIPGSMVYTYSQARTYYFDSISFVGGAEEVVAASSASNAGGVSFLSPSGSALWVCLQKFHILRTSWHQSCIPCPPMQHPIHMILCTVNSATQLEVLGGQQSRGRSFGAIRLFGEKHHRQSETMHHNCGSHARW